VAWAEVLVLAAGVVVGDCSEVLPEEVLGVAVVEDVDVEEEELFEEEVFDAIDVDVFEAVVDGLEVDVVVLAWCGWAARTANSPTPASDPAASQPVVARLRRTQVSRWEGVGMSSVRPPGLRVR
jgi:hypothetical protein